MKSKIQTVIKYNNGSTQSLGLSTLYHTCQEKWLPIWCGPYGAEPRVEKRMKHPRENGGHRVDKGEEMMRVCRCFSLSGYSRRIASYDDFEEDIPVRTVIVEVEMKQLSSYTPLCGPLDVGTNRSSIRCTGCTAVDICHVRFLGCWLWVPNISRCILAQSGCMRVGITFSRLDIKWVRTVTNPSCSQLNRENSIFLVPVRAWGFVFKGEVRLYPVRAYLRWI